MVLAKCKTISFDDFISWLPERSAFCYELHEGEIIERSIRNGTLIQSPTFTGVDWSIDFHGSIS
jgi:hypothetical protein